MDIAPRIRADGGVRFGKAVISGTRVPVDLIVAKLAGGMSYEEVMAEYEVSREDILAALDYGTAFTMNWKAKRVLKVRASLYSHSPKALNL